MLAADRRRKEPREVPRPWQKNTAAEKPKEGLSVNSDGGMKAQGHAGLLAAAQMRGAVRLGE